MFAEAKTNMKYSAVPPLPTEPFDPEFLYFYEEVGAYRRLRWRQVGNRVERGDLHYVDNDLPV